MVSSKAATVEEYLAELPENRRADIQQVREVILANLPDGFVECMQYGMIGYAIPLEDFPNTYNGQASGWLPWPPRNAISPSTCTVFTPTPS